MVRKWENILLVVPPSENKEVNSGSTFITRDESWSLVNVPYFPCQHNNKIFSRVRPSRFILWRVIKYDFCPTWETGGSWRSSWSSCTSLGKSPAWKMTVSLVILFTSGFVPQWMAFNTPVCSQAKRGRKRSGMKQGQPKVQLLKSRLYFCGTFAWFLRQLCHLEIYFLSTPWQMPQTITNIPRCLPQILTLPMFWYHLANSFSRENVPFDFERS